jgi:hypothetical protein
MNAQDPEAMRALDARLGRLHQGLDTRPGFEDRLAARVAAMKIDQAAALSPAALARLERVHERERREADRQARLDSAVIAAAGLGAAVAVWRFAPLIARLLETYASAAQVAPALFAAGSLLAAGVVLWAALRKLGFAPGSLLGA